MTMLPLVIGSPRPPVGSGQLAEATASKANVSPGNLAVMCGTHSVT
jgi:hypothetical protein